MLPVPNYWTRTKTTPQKIFVFFLSNPYKIETIIPSVIEMLELSDFVTWPDLQYDLSHMIKFCS